jgi:uncharacterized protein (DUF952 family)
MTGDEDTVIASEVILHIIPAYAWEHARQYADYRGDTLEAEGFIHFSTPDQIVATANRRFRGHTGLLLLVVDPARLAHELRYEAPFEGTSADGDDYRDQRFPHLYGPLNLDAVIDVLPFEPDADGLFHLPPALAR